MDQDALKLLINKYLEGKASHAEVEELFRYYDDRQENVTWQEALMGEQEMVKKRLYNKIVEEIGHRERVRKISFSRIAGVAAAVAILLGLASLLLLFRQHGGNTETMHMLTKAAPADRIDSLRLADGTMVILNNGSSISYPERFENGERKIILSGEAFFDVRPQKAPFIIHAGNTITRVLGTSFNVRAYENDERIKISVLSGKVAVSTGHDQQAASVVLVRGEQAIYTKHSHNISRSAADPLLALAWKEGKIKFRNTPFPEAIAALSSIYNVRITFHKNLRNCPLFADFDRTDKPDSVLDILSRSVNGKLLRKNDGTYVLTGPGCK
jgi:ferric-dicitrate binding protein FerR (iron transport regulator)